MSASEADMFAVDVDGDTTLPVVKFLRGRGFGALMTKETLCMLPADLTDECVASTAAAAAEFEVLAVLRIDAGISACST